MQTQMEVIRKHLDEHMYLRKISDRNKAVETFVADYGWLIRELYCTRICEFRTDCQIATELSGSGDLLSKHVKKPV